MSDTIQIALIVTVACLLAGGIWSAYDIARRKLEGLQDALLVGMNSKIDELAKQLEPLENHELRIQKLRDDLTELRDHNTAEFAAMKTAFDRFTTKQAVSETMGFDSRAQRQF